jgi:hypothetical protein
LDNPCLSKDDFPSSLKFKLTGQWLDGCSHVVDNDALLLWSIVNEAGGPSFEGLEAEGEAVLTRGKATAIVDHGLLSGEHISRLEVPHFIVAVPRCPNVAWTVVVIIVFLGLAIGYGEILYESMGTSELKMRWGGIAAIGS